MEAIKAPLFSIIETFIGLEAAIVKEVNSVSILLIIAITE